MVPITVTRLVVHAPGRSAGEGERLARAVADQLRRTTLPGGRVDRLAVRLTAVPNESSDRLAARIVADAERQLGRELRLRGE
jgi:hypothetical protein